MTRCVVLLGMVLVGCGIVETRRAWINPQEARLGTVAESSRQWTGIAISEEGRLFVNYPLWAPAQEFAVGEVLSNGEVVPYPNVDINSWTPGQSPRDHFVCVQALLVDDEQQLWVLDPANPRFEGVVPEGPKLVVVKLNAHELTFAS